MKFTVPGEPCGKQRPRVVQRGGHAQAYTPAKTANYETLVQFEYSRQCGHEFLGEGPIQMNITAYFGIPKSASKRKRAAMLSGEAVPTRAPDIDNIAKLISDACNGLAYKDDSQVVKMKLFKRYAEVPHVDVEIVPYEGGGEGDVHGESEDTG